MKMIEQNSVDRAFNQKAAREITIVMRSEREWYFTFVADDPVTGKPNKYTLLTQRGKLRTWADPKYLLNFFRKEGLSTAVLVLMRINKMKQANILQKTIHNKIITTIAFVTAFL